jgi:hypothetical protein
MAINVQYAADPRLLSEAAYLAGSGQFQQEQDKFRFGVDQAHLNLGEQQRQFDMNYGQRGAEFAYKQFDDTRRFGEGVRQFDAGHDLRLDQFGEQQRQSDFDNQYRDVALDVQTGLAYDRMAQEEAMQLQRQAFEAQQQEQQRQAAFAQQDNALRNQRWTAYQGLEGQRADMAMRQGMAQLEKIQKTQFRTPELQAKAYADWEQRYGSYLPAPINIGEPPEVQDPWQSVPVQEMELPDGSKVPIHLVPDGKGGWKPDASVAKIHADVSKGQVKQQADAAKAQQDIQKKEQEQQIKKSESEFKAKEKYRETLYDAAVKMSEAMQKQQEDSKKLEMESKIRAIEAAAAAEAASKTNSDTGQVTPPRDISGDILKIKAEVDAKYPPIVSPDTIMQAYQMAQQVSGMAMGGQGDPQQSEIPVDEATGLPMPATPEQAMTLPPGTKFLHADGTVRIRP